MSEPQMGLLAAIESNYPVSAIFTLLATFFVVYPFTPGAPPDKKRRPRDRCDRALRPQLKGSNTALNGL